MNLEQLEQTLPNGLHDARLLGLAIDYAARTVHFDLDVHVGTTEGSEEEREAYRPARLTLTGLQFVVIDPPSASYPYGEISRIDTGRGEPHTAKLELPPTAPGHFLAWMYVSKWNSFIRIAARAAVLDWVLPR